MWLANCYFSSHRACKVVTSFRRVSTGAAQEVRQERRLRLLRGNRLSAWEPISQIIAQLLVRSWDNGWGSTGDRIALKRRQRNDLVGFELFFRSQTLYPTELRARSVSPSTITRCDAKLQLCSPDFVAHVAQLKPGSEMSAMGISKRVPPSPPILQSIVQQMFSNISPIQTYSETPRGALGG